MGQALSLQGPALWCHTLGAHVSPPLKTCDLEQGTSPLRAPVPSSEVGLLTGWSHVVVCDNQDGAQCLA